MQWEKGRKVLEYYQNIYRGISRQLQGWYKWHKRLSHLTSSVSTDKVDACSHQLEQSMGIDNPVPFFSCMFHDAGSILWGSPAIQKKETQPHRCVTFFTNGNRILIPVHNCLAVGLPSFYGIHTHGIVLPPSN